MASLLLARMGEKLGTYNMRSGRRLSAGLDWHAGLRDLDRFDLANTKFHSAQTDLGPVELSLSGGRAANFEQRYALPLTVDRWALKFLGASATLPLAPSIAFVLDAQYARMARRLSVLEVTPHRLATTMAQFGGGFTFGNDSSLFLDYLSVKRSSGQNELTRLAEALGGAPATGHGPELSFSHGSGTAAGQSNWRLTLASLRRPMRDLGLAADNDIRSDARATLNFTLHF
ncbi:hypothetical protein [Sphingobium sp. EM0848]|uniref:hypothetical protein n=1 Tax=Sphingobium sp. EM0848 TaxID=2743473 RepID=UPI00159CA30C|nr:hypothetical protein [Sphingobium sp. EM0848]